MIDWSPLSPGSPHASLTGATLAVACASYGKVTIAMWTGVREVRFLHIDTVQGWEPRVIWIAVGGCVFFTALEAAKKLYAPKAAHLK